MTNFPNSLNRFSGFSEQIMLSWRLWPVGGLKNPTDFYFRSYMLY